MAFRPLLDMKVHRQNEHKVSVRTEVNNKNNLMAFISRDSNNNKQMKKKITQLSKRLSAHKSFIPFNLNTQMH
jgi:hypothetical protein